MFEGLSLPLGCLSMIWNVFPDAANNELEKSLSRRLGRKVCSFFIFIVKEFVLLNVE